MTSVETSVCHATPLSGGVDATVASIFELVRLALAHQLRARQLETTDRLADLGLSSLRLIGLIVSLEETFELDPRRLMELTADSRLADVIAMCRTTQEDGTASQTASERAA